MILFIISEGDFHNARVLEEKAQNTDQDQSGLGGNQKLYSGKS